MGSVLFARLLAGLYARMSSRDMQRGCPPPRLRAAVAIGTHTCSDVTRPMQVFQPTRRSCACARREEGHGVRLVGPPDKAWRRGFRLKPPLGKLFLVVLKVRDNFQTGR